MKGKSSMILQLKYSNGKNSNNGKVQDYFAPRPLPSLRFIIEEKLPSARIT